MIHLTQLKGFLLITLQDAEELQDIKNRGGFVSDALDGAGYLGNGVHEPVDGWLGMTNAPCIGFGEYELPEFDDGNVPTAVGYEAAYYYADYMITCWMEHLLEEGWVLFYESPQTIDTHDKSNPIPHVYQQHEPIPRDVFRGLMEAVTYNFHYRSNPLFPRLGEAYQVTDGRIIPALERRNNYYKPDRKKRGKELCPQGTGDNKGVYHVLYKGHGYFKTSTGTGIGWWKTKNQL